MIPIIQTYSFDIYKRKRRTFFQPLEIDCGPDLNHRSGQSVAFHTSPLGEPTSVVRLRAGVIIDAITGVTSVIRVRVRGLCDALVMVKRE